jgi:NADH-quinone oxidoreductase subunit N
MLAYSSIAHAGYLMVAFASASNRELGISAAMFYSAAYAAMNVGAFAVITHMAGSNERYSQIDDYSGLGRRSPVLAAALTFFLLSLIGIPMTGGFFAKFYVFSAAMHSNLVVLTIIGVINSAIAAYYYLRIIVYMYMRDERAVEAPVAPIPLSLGAGLVISLVAVIYLGVLPNHVLDYAIRGAQDLLK